MSKQLEMTKAAIDGHNKDLLSGDFNFLHFTPENENTYKLGFYRGVNYAAALLKLQDKEPVKIVLDDENIRTLHY